MRTSFPPAAEQSAGAGEPTKPRHLITPGRVARFVSLLWLAAAGLLYVGATAATLSRPFDWSSAQQATMARSFAQQGVVHLRGVPVQNNPPAGLEPDLYLHWPPLFPILLSFVVRALGESEVVTRLLMFGIAALTACVLYALVKSCCGRPAGLFAVATYIALPVTIVFVEIEGRPKLAILFWLLALLAFLRATQTARLRKLPATLGAGALLLGVLCSWEPVLLCPGLLLISILQRNRTRSQLSLLYTGVAAFAFFGVIAWYLYQAPALAQDFWHTVSYRSGLGYGTLAEGGVHTIVDRLYYATVPTPTLPALLLRYLRWLTMLGTVPVLALAVVLVGGLRDWRQCKQTDLAVLFFGLLSVWILWFALVPNHAAIHSFQMMIAAPAAAAATGLALGKVLSRAEDRSRVTLRRWAAAGIALVVLLATAAYYARPVVLDQTPDPLVAFAAEIARSTPAGTVVMTTEPGMVPVYYSRRHLIRYVINDQLVDQVAMRAPRLFSTAPLYLAIHPQEAKDFSMTLERYPVVWRSPDLILISISAQRP